MIQFFYFEICGYDCLIYVMFMNCADKLNLVPQSCKRAVDAVASFGLIGF